MSKVKEKKEKKNIEQGIAHIQASFNNTIVSISDVRGNIISWSKHGLHGFKDHAKSPLRLK